MYPQVHSMQCVIYFKPSTYLQKNSTRGRVDPSAGDTLARLAILWAQLLVTFLLEVLMYFRAHSEPPVSHLKVYFHLSEDLPGVSLDALLTSIQLRVS